MNQKSSFIDRF